MSSNAACRVLLGGVKWNALWGKKVARRIFIDQWQIRSHCRLAVSSVADGLFALNGVLESLSAYGNTALRHGWDLQVENRMEGCDDVMQLKCSSSYWKLRRVWLTILLLARSVCRQKESVHPKTFWNMPNSA